MSYTSVVKLWNPVPIDEQSSTVVFDEGGTTASLDLFNHTLTSERASERGIWYSATSRSYSGVDGVFDKLALTPLHAVLRRALNDTFNNTYEWVSYTPPNSEISNTSLYLNRASGTQSFSWVFSSGSWTLDPRILGFGAGRASGALATDEDSSNGKIIPPYSLLGAVHFDALKVPPAKDFRSQGAGMVAKSKMDPRFGYAQQWEPRQGGVDGVGSFGGKRDGTDFHVWRRTMVRRLRLQKLPAARVFGKRADDADEADRAGITQGDENASLDHWWHYAAIGPVGIRFGWNRGYHEILDDSDQDNTVFASFAKEAQAKKFREIVSPVDGADGELYDASMDLYQGHSQLYH